MFWGLIMEPQKRYSQIVQKAFHISMASLDLTSSNTPNDIVQVMVGHDTRKYLLCTLQVDKVVQCPLDLNFDVGTEVSFVTNGNTFVHLTGYLIQEEENLFDDVDDEEEEEENEQDVSVGNISASNIVGGKRSKPSGKLEGQLNGMAGKIEKKLAALAKNAPPTKKMKTMDLLKDIDDDEDEDDSDVDLSALLAEEEEDDDESILDNEAADDDDDQVESESEDQSEDNDDETDEEEETDDESDDDGSDDESDDKEVEVEDVSNKSKQNGVAKKSKKEPVSEKKLKQEEKKKPEIKTPKSEKKKQQQQQKSSPKKTIEGGIVIEDLREGNGPSAKAGKMIQVYYEGRFKNNNKMFDSSTKGNGFKFRLGRGEVIKGWDIGVCGMKVGGKRRIICPPSAAYGQKGSPPTIPPNSTLVFEVELKNVN